MANEIYIVRQAEQSDDPTAVGPELKRFIGHDGWSNAQKYITELNGRGIAGYISIVNAISLIPDFQPGCGVTLEQALSSALEDRDPDHVWNPVSRFEKINEGFCPDCDEKLSDSGDCLDCHITPSLDPGFQRWLKGAYTDAQGNIITRTNTDHGRTFTATVPIGFTGQGYTADQALSAARWYQEQAAKSYNKNPPSPGSRARGIKQIYQETSRRLKDCSI